MRLPNKLEDKIVYRFLGNLNMRMEEENERIKNKIGARKNKE